MTSTAPQRGFPLPRNLFDEARYLALNADVAAAVARGDTQAYQHYIDHGHKEELRGDRQRSVPLVSSPLCVRSNAPDALLDRVIDLEVEKQVLLEMLGRRAAAPGEIDFEMLSENVDDALVPMLDRFDCDESKLDADQMAWRRDGFLIKTGFFPDDLLDRYSEISARVPNTGGWSCPVPYMHIAELRDVCLHPPLMHLLQHLIGEEMGCISI